MKKSIDDIISCRSACPNLFYELSKFVLGMDIDPFSRLSTESENTSSREVLLCQFNAQKLML